VRVLAIDHGSVRCGCAISDPTGTVARPLPVIEPPDPRAVAELVAEHEVELIVIGLPIGLSGGAGAQATAARRFGDEVAAIVDVTVETYDERLTTKMAQRTARSGAAAAEDSLAAAHLLESYLAARGGQDESEADDSP
jgi:putative holliday junction resolvase